MPGRAPDPLPGKPSALREPGASGNTPGRAQAGFGVSRSGCRDVILYGALYKRAEDASCLFRRAKIRV